MKDSLALDRSCRRQLNSLLHSAKRNLGFARAMQENEVRSSYVLGARAAVCLKQAVILLESNLENGSDLLSSHRSGLALLENEVTHAFEQASEPISDPSPAEVESCNRFLHSVELNLHLLERFRRKFEESSIGLFIEKFFAKLRSPSFQRRGAIVLIAGILAVGAARVRQMALDKNHGLNGDYFEDVEFTNLYLSKKDRNVDFVWRYSAPLRNFRHDRFSIRWSGFLNVPEGGLYHFSTLTDDGIRLWIDDQLIIDDWHGHPETMNEGEVQLAQGPHRLKMEYFDDISLATAKLFWRRQNQQEKQIIPQKFFSFEPLK